MDDFKLNAAKIIAAQQKRNSGARSPESDSNWDSTDPEDTLPNVSSEEEVSVVSSRSRGKGKTQTAKGVKQESRQQLQPHKPISPRQKPPSSNRLTVDGERFSNKSSPVSSIRSGKVSKAGVNVFIDHGNGDSSDEDVSVASRKSAPRKEERPPYDFRNALQEPARNEDRMSDRPGKSRKGHLYDPSHDSSHDLSHERLDNSSKSDDKQLIVDVPDGSKSKKKKWKVNLGFQSDTAPNAKTPSNNNNLGQSLQKDHTMTTMTTTTTSDIELRKMEESMMGRMSENDADDAGRYDDVQMQRSPLLIEESMQRYVYQYQHGNTRYYDTRSSRQDVYMTGIADKSERLVRRGVQEFFAALRIIIDFLLILLLEFLRFLSYNVFGLLFVGLLTTFGDYFFKPVLAALFNSILQPTAVFLYNTGVALRTVFGPLIDILRAVFTQFAMLLRALRLVEINWRAGPQNAHRGIENV